MVCYLKHPNWSEDECHNYGANATEGEAQSLLTKRASPQGEEATRDFVQSRDSESFPNNRMEEIVAETLKIPRRAAAQSAWSVMSGDYRDILPTIKVPTLWIGGLQSHIPLECMSWAASEIPDAELTLVPGRHHMFMEQPEPFNLALSDFFLSRRPLA